MLLIYYLDSLGEAGLKNFTHAFCKANSSLGGKYRALCGNRNERVLDINASSSMSVSSLLQSSPETKGNGSFFFLHITKRMSAPLEMSTPHQSSRSVFRVSGSPYYLDFLCFSTSFWYFMDDRWGLSLHLQTANKEVRVYLSVSLFMYFSTSFFRGVSASCITQLWIMAWRQALFIFSEAQKLWRRWSHRCIYRILLQFKCL